MRSTTTTTWSRSVDAPRSPLALDRLAGTRSVPSVVRGTRGEVCPQPIRVPAAGISQPATRVLFSSRFRTVPGTAPGGPPA